MDKSKLSILVDEKKVNDLLKQKSGAKAFIRSCINLVLFIAFLILFTVLALGEPLSQHRGFEAYLRRRFDYGAAMPLHDIKSINDVYDYVNRTLLPGFYGNDTAIYFYPGYEPTSFLGVDNSREGVSWANNILLGLMRIRQLKVLPNQDCKVQEQFSPYFPTCYGTFKEEAEDVEEFGPTAQQGGKEFQYFAAPGFHYTGQLATYPPGGHMQAFNANYSRSVEILDLIKNAGFFTAATRAIFMEFTIYNTNTGFYGVCRILLEASACGAWLKTFDVTILEQRHLQPLGDGGSQAWVLLIAEATLVLFVVRYLLEEASEFIGCHDSANKRWWQRVFVKTAYFGDGWNIIDWANLILMIVVMGYRIETWGLVSDALVDVNDYATTDLNTFVDLNAVVQNVRTLRNLQAFNAVLTWFKAVKYINIIPYVSVFMETVNIASGNLIAFISVFIAGFIGFCLAFSTAFGEQLSLFRTPPRAFVFLLRSFLGNADLRQVMDAAPFLGSLLILLFICGMIFVVMNLFYAIMISALSDARQTQEMKQSKEWNKVMDKVQSFWETMKEVLSLEARFRACVPGLASRLKKRRKDAETKENLRDMQAASKASAKLPQKDVEDALGPASPSAGRRKKRVQSSVTAAEDEIESDAGSEPDIGPLSKDKLMRMTGQSDMFMLPLEDGAGNMAGTMGSGDWAGNTSGMGFGNAPAAPDEEMAEDAMELVLDATEHVVKGIKERCRGARSLVLSEMSESRQVLQGIGSVLEVLGRRVRSLEAQQEQLLPRRPGQW
mmetsp:Transcript_138232/g.240549  ORF Transcript_138232/g.240549 Transcript_138232/m.240549 type:complete len:778 (-) Transcript_138232:165-2498(-)